MLDLGRKAAIEFVPRSEVVRAAGQYARGRQRSEVEVAVESSERFIEIPDRIGEGGPDHRIDDHTIDRDAHLIANATRQLGDFTGGEFLGERNRKHERLVGVLEHALDALCMYAKRAGPHRRYDHARNVEKRNTVSRGRCVHDDEVELATWRIFGVELGEVPDLSERDQLAPSGGRGHELAKGPVAHHGVHDRANPELQAEILRERLEGFDPHGSKAGEDRAARIARPRRARVQQAWNLLVGAHFGDQDPEARPGAGQRERSGNRRLPGPPLSGDDHEPVFQKGPLGACGQKGPPRAWICRFGGLADLKQGPFASETNQADRDRESPPSIAGAARSARSEIGRGSISVFITCGNCDAEYELDDSKIPAGGARLRCTNCDHSFVIVPPEASDLQRADDLARDALSTEAPGGADPDPKEEAAPEEDFDPDGESDWEFNEEVGLSEPEEEEEDAPEPEPAFDQSGDWGELSTAEDAVDEAFQSGGSIEADAASDVDDLLGEIAAADSQRGELTSDLTSGSELPGEGLGGAAAFDGAAGGPAADGSDSFEDLSDGDPDPPAANDVSAGPENAVAAAARDGARAEPQVKIAVAMVHDSSTNVRWTDRISEIAGWGSVLLMMIVALVVGLASNSSDARVTAGSWGDAGFEADQIVGRWVDNAVSGSIYVVSGRIRRASGSDWTSRKALGIRLIDTTGRQIDGALIPLAPAIPERILRESSPSELDAFQARRADQITAVGKGWISFEAVLTNLPRSADRFELQALDR